MSAPPSASRAATPAGSAPSERGFRARRPERAPDEAALFLLELIDGLPAGSRVLDAGCGPGSWDYGRREGLDLVAFDRKFPPGPPAPSPGLRVFRGDLARTPLRGETFDLVVCHYVLEHVTELEPCCDELARLTRLGGDLYLAVPRAAAFDDRLYRFAGRFAKYALLKLGKRLEHQQRFDFSGLLDRFYARGFELVSYARVPAGFSWMNDPRTQPLQGGFVGALARLHRTLGWDLARDANFVLRLRKTGARGVRRVTHVCRACGEHCVLSGEPWPATWTCPWCGASNPLGRPR